MSLVLTAVAYLVCGAFWGVIVASLPTRSSYGSRHAHLSRLLVHGFCPMLFFVSIRTVEVTLAYRVPYAITLLLYVWLITFFAGFIGTYYLTPIRLRKETP
ncbi:MAG: hypothetical protein GIX02_00580 [Candidatus Eremiobacteraeota bacterium]|nr:hypothetical protein [Candidatus Eremiobacteraeota bacterium]